ncbi:hypothetical protein Ltuc_1100 [Legionella tucsonensis]|uniref:Uncharacterized protein n=1 Tax=Legionella tucsonensis TaxID=40335 RepID=A0A0W0ZVS9_9GAMM|nr:hypothetical protein [Legionella tucsonensis]KTD73253.1 hypothetical protein Ltuc_1100 [Legionella tucsonensis]
MSQQQGYLIWLMDLYTYDKVTRFLRLEDFGSKSLWHYVKSRLGSSGQLVWLEGQYGSHP